MKNVIGSQRPKVLGPIYLNFILSYNFLIVFFN